MSSTIIIHTENREQENALKAFAKALNIKFEVARENPYAPEFVDKVLKGDKDFADGKGVKISLEEFKDLCK
ncbi:DUF2683 family protein [Lunatibacter salilacus]|uniref:DUF2683 family protein n=1 Tax=Lunatibacter salilacus TaxID=2483804 RepID=UPI00131B0544|nr:DUF2683 family protein [Lunatibacter salilacus]